MWGIYIAICHHKDLGDIFISYIKRKAKVKDTGNFLPGHGGLLDRIDGIIFAIPGAFILGKYFFNLWKKKLLSSVLLDL